MGGITLVDLLESSFLEFKDRTVFNGKTYREIESDVKSLASFLQDKNSNVVMTIARDSYLALVSTLAAFMAGTIVTGPVTLGNDESNTAIEERVRWQLNILKEGNKKPDTIILDSYHYTLLSPAIKEMTNSTIISNFDKISGGALSFDGILGFPNEYKPKSIKPEDIAVILFTSGTTGEEKGVILSHNAIAQNAFQESYTFGITAADKVMFVSHLRHILGLNATMGVLSAGGEVLFYTNKRKLAKELVNNDYNVLVSPPLLGENLRKKVERLSRLEVLAANLLGKTPLKKWQDKNFRLIFGGAHVPERLIKFFADHGIKVYEGYGTTEAGIVLVNTPEHHKDGSMGIPLMGPKIQLVNPLRDVEISDVEVKTRETDKGTELLIGGPQIMSGYLNAQNPFIEMEGKRYVPTGDIVDVVKNSKSFFFFKGRMDDIIKRKNGEKVSLDELSSYFTEISYISRSKAVYNPKEDKITLRVEPDFSALPRLKYGKSLSGLNKSQKERLEELIRGEVRKWNSNLPEYKRVADISLAKIPITPTGKIKYENPTSC